MKLFKNIIDEELEYRNKIAKFNEQGKLIDIDTIEMAKLITISLNEYKELLVCKGKYESLKENADKIVDSLLQHYKKGDISPNQVRELLGFKKIGGNNEKEN